MQGLFAKPIITPTIISILILGVAYSAGAQAALVLIDGDLWSQVWRIFGTHLVHINLMHAGYNILGLWLLTILFQDLFTNRLLFNVMLFSALFSTLVPVYVATDYHFVGLSGVLHGVFAYAALRTLTIDKKNGLILLALVGLKLAYDLFTAGQSVDWLNGATVAYWCHIGGVLGGATAVPTLRKTSHDFFRSSEKTD